MCKQNPALKRLFYIFVNTINDKNDIENVIFFLFLFLPELKKPRKKLKSGLKNGKNIWTLVRKMKKWRRMMKLRKPTIRKAPGVVLIVATKLMKRRRLNEWKLLKMLTKCIAVAQRILTQSGVSILHQSFWLKEVIYCFSFTSERILL